MLLTYKWPSYLLDISFSSSLSTVVETSQISPESWAEVEFNCKKSPIFATGRNAEKCAKELRLAKSESNLERMNAKKKHYFHDSKFPF